MAFDLDPGAPAGVTECCEVAVLLRDALHQIGLDSYPKTSGSKGLQVYVPLNTEVDYDHGTKRLSLALARHLEAQHPKLIVEPEEGAAQGQGADRLEPERRAQDNRGGLLCARERPTVSTPLRWEEVERGDPDALVFEAADVLERVNEHGDLFAPVVEQEQRLPEL